MPVFFIELLCLICLLGVIIIHNKVDEILNNYEYLPKKQLAPLIFWFTWMVILACLGGGCLGAILSSFIL